MREPAVRNPKMPRPEPVLRWMDAAEAWFEKMAEQLWMEQEQERFAYSAPLRSLALALQCVPLVALLDWVSCHLVAAHFDTDFAAQD